MNMSSEDGVRQTKVLAQGRFIEEPKVLQQQVEGTQERKKAHMLEAHGSHDTGWR